MNKNRYHILKIVLVAALAALLAVPAVAAGEDAPPDEVFALVRTTPGPSYLEFSVSQSSGVVGGEQHAYFGAVVLADHDEGEVFRSGEGLLLGSDGGAFPSVYADGMTVQTCEGPTDPTGQCGDFGSGSSGSTLFFGTPDENLLIVMLKAGGVVEVSEKSVGWEYVEVPDGTITSRQSSESQAVGVSRRGVGAEVFLSAEMVTDLEKSLALAMPPCGGLPTGLAPGVSRLTLLGGNTSPTKTCPAIELPAITDIATGPTTWRVEGVAAGDTGVVSRTRLAVTDLLAVERAVELFLCEEDPACDPAVLVGEGQ